MATAPFRKCISGVAGTPVMDSPIARIATSSVPLVTLARTALRWYFSMARLAAAATSSSAAPLPCLGVALFWPTVLSLVEAEVFSPACSLPPPQPARAKEAAAAPAPNTFSACLRDIVVPLASPLADVATTILERWIGFGLVIRLALLSRLGREDASVLFSCNGCSLDLQGALAYHPNA